MLKYTVLLIFVVVKLRFLLAEQQVTINGLILQSRKEERNPYAQTAALMHLIMKLRLNTVS